MKITKLPSTALPADRSLATITYKLCNMAGAKHCLRRKHCFDFGVGRRLERALSLISHFHHDVGNRFLFGDLPLGEFICHRSKTFSRATRLVASEREPTVLSRWHVSSPLLRFSASPGWRQTARRPLIKGAPEVAKAAVVSTVRRFMAFPSLNCGTNLKLGGKFYHLFIARDHTGSRPCSLPLKECRRLSCRRICASDRSNESLITSFPFDPSESNRNPPQVI